MKYGSVSSGIDAASVAFGPFGWKAQWFSEIAPFPSAVLTYHYPNVPNLGDMVKIYDKREFRERTVDAICGGTPCQSFSVAGLRKGLSDERGNLSLEFCRIVHTKKSRWVLWENVPGVLSSKDNAFGCFLAALSGGNAPLLPGTRNGKWAKSGIVSGPVYGLAWRVLDAQYFGVPQRRRRVFVVGYLGDWRPAAEVLFEPEGVCRDTTESRAKRKDTPVCFETGPGGGRNTDIAPTLDTKCKDGPIRNQAGLVIINRKVSFGEYVPDDKASPVLARDSKDSTDLITQYGPIAGTLSARHDSSPCSDRGQNIVYENHGQDSRIKEVEVSPTVSSKFQKDSGDLPIVFKHQPEGDVLQSDKAYTLSTTSNASGGNTPKIFNGTVRRLTPIECERLQGFPDNYTRIPWRGKAAEECPDGPRYKAIGNSWAIPCVRWIGERIQAVDDILKKGVL